MSDYHVAGTQMLFILHCVLILQTRNLQLREQLAGGYTAGQRWTWDSSPVLHVPEATVLASNHYADTFPCRYFTMMKGVGSLVLSRAGW